MDRGVVMLCFRTPDATRATYGGPAPCHAWRLWSCAEECTVLCRMLMVLMMRKVPLR